MDVNTALLLLAGGIVCTSVAFVAGLSAGGHITRQAFSDAVNRARK